MADVTGYHAAARDCPAWQPDIEWPHVRTASSVFGAWHPARPSPALWLDLPVLPGDRVEPDRAGAPLAVPDRLGCRDHCLSGARLRHDDALDPADDPPACHPAPRRAL